MITQEILRKYLSYDPLTGIFIWAVNSGRHGRIKAGTIAGCLTFYGYTKILLCGEQILAHRLAWFYVNGSWPIGQIDHINCIKTDNRIINLRDVTRGINQQNKITHQFNNKLGFLGVSKQRNKYVACIHTYGKTKYIGTYETPELAHAAYVKEKRKTHAGCTL